MIRQTRFAAPLVVAALLAACVPRDDAPAPVVQHDTAAAVTVATAQPQRFAPHPSSMPPGLRTASAAVATPSAAATVVVQRGETLSAIARRFGTTAPVLAQHNNLKPPYGVQAGQKIAIPGAAPAAEPVMVAAAKPVPAERSKATDYRPLAVKAAPIPPPAAEPISNVTVSSSPRSSVHAVSLSAPEPMKAEPMKAEPAKAEPARAPIAVGDTLRPDPAKVQALRAEAQKFEAPKAEPAPVVLAKAEAPKATALADATDQHVLKLPAKAAAAEAEEVTPVPTAYKAMPKPTVADLPARSSRNFQWPVKGKLISSYGPQPGGLRNDGFNIAASKGANVVAAENGVVAYAGDDLKGFGNLVLIKHAGGFVTTYAHNDKLMVKRGDKVKRGQVIATVGTSGAVTQPQVHFQIRQGQHAVDPRPLMERS